MSPKAPIRYYKACALFKEARDDFEALLAMARAYPAKNWKPWIASYNRRLDSLRLMVRTAEVRERRGQ